MIKNRMNPEAEVFFTTARLWKEEMEMLRMIVLNCHLTEEVKWGKPCYTFQDHNVVILQGFKNYCALLFFKGVLLPDPDNILVKTGENTQVGRQMRFTHIQQIIEKETSIKNYIQGAVELEKSGAKVELKKTSDFEIPQEFQSRFNVLPALQKAFTLLTPGRQRAYILYFSQPKQAKTRELRIEKCIPQILNGKGLNDR